MMPHTGPIPGILSYMQQPATTPIISAVATRSAYPPLSAAPKSELSAADEIAKIFNSKPLYMNQNPDEEVPVVN
jgi:hypothetical protein